MFAFGLLVASVFASALAAPLDHPAFSVGHHFGELVNTEDVPVVGEVVSGVVRRTGEGSSIPKVIPPIEVKVPGVRRQVQPEQIPQLIADFKGNLLGFAETLKGASSEADAKEQLKSMKTNCINVVSALAPQLSNPQDNAVDTAALVVDVTDLTVAVTDAIKVVDSKFGAAVKPEATTTLNAISSLFGLLDIVFDITNELQPAADLVASTGQELGFAPSLDAAN